MYCKKCGAENSDSAAFCKSCGERLGTDTGRGNTPNTPQKKKKSLLPIVISISVVVIALLVAAAIFFVVPKMSKGNGDEQNQTTASSYSSDENDTYDTTAGQTETGTGSGYNNTSGNWYISKKQIYKPTHGNYNVTEYQQKNGQLLTVKEYSKDDINDIINIEENATPYEDFAEYEEIIRIGDAYEYDDQNRLIICKSILDSGKNYIFYDIEYTEVNGKYIGKAYNDCGWEDKDGNMKDYTCCTEYTYDLNGKLLTKKVYYDDTMAETTEYNDRGLIAKTINSNYYDILDNPNETVLYDIETFEYNENGFVTSHKYFYNRTTENPDPDNCDSYRNYSFTNGKITECYNDDVEFIFSESIDESTDKLTVLGFGDPHVYILVKYNDNGLVESITDYNDYHAEYEPSTRLLESYEWAQY